MLLLWSLLGDSVVQTNILSLILETHNTTEPSLFSLSENSANFI